MTDHLHDLDDRDVRIIASIQEYWQIHNTGPTYQDVADVMGASKSSVWRWIQRLAGLGWVEMNPDRHRTLKLARQKHTFWLIEAEDGGEIAVTAKDQERATSLAKYYLADKGRGRNIRRVREVSIAISDLLSRNPADLEVVVARSIPEKDEES